MNRYAVLDGSGNIINVVVWDGVAEWDPPAGCTAIESSVAEIGGTIIDNVYTPPEDTGPLQVEG